MIRVRVVLESDFRDIFINKQTILHTMRYVIYQLFTEFIVSTCPSFSSALLLPLHILIIKIIEIIMTHYNCTNYFALKKAHEVRLRNDVFRFILFRNTQNTLIIFCFALYLLLYVGYINQSEFKCQVI